MTDKPENPPAFPCIDNAGPNGQTIWRHDGMTLRDYFAAAALQGMITTSGAPFLMPDPHDIESLAANGAYKFADAMMKAREP